MSYLEKTIAGTLTAEEVRERARAWYDRQILILSQAHGPSWEANRAWIEDYLKEELREHVHALGWRPKP